MVLKPQLQELLSKQFLKRPWESISKNSNLLLAVVRVGPNSAFLSDGILTVQTSLGMDLGAKFQAEDGFDIQLKDLEGFVCLFENCRIEISSGDRFERPKQGGLADVFRKKDFRSEARRGDVGSTGHSILSNMEQVKGDRTGGFEVVNRTVIDLEASTKGPTRRIKKKGKSRRAKLDNKSMSSESSNQKKEAENSNPIINFYINFDSFNVICPLGKYFLSGKREMIVDSLSEERRKFFERKFKLEKHIKKMRDPKNNSLVPVLELGDIIEEIHGRKKTSSKDETRTTTSTPSGDTTDFVESYKIPTKLRSKKRSRKKRKL